MKTFKINGVIVNSEMEDFSRDEAARYVRYLKTQLDPELWHRMRYLSVDVIEREGGGVDLDYYVFDKKFERIRRITGYLTGTLDTWNNAKRKEESERVKHNTEALAQPIKN